MVSAMPMLAMIVGGLLTLLGFGGYAIALSGDAGYASWTALIPAIAGLPILILGAFAHIGPNLRKHLMHAAVAWALLGAIAPLGRLPATLSADPVNYVSAVSMILMMALCAFFVIAGVRSFVAARKARNAPGGFEVQQ